MSGEGLGRHRDSGCAGGAVCCLTIYNNKQSSSQHKLTSVVSLHTKFLQFSRLGHVKFSASFAILFFICPLKSDCWQELILEQWRQAEEEDPLGPHGYHDNAESFNNLSREDSREQTPFQMLKHLESHFVRTVSVAGAEARRSWFPCG